MSCLRHNFDPVRNAAELISAAKTMRNYTVTEMIEEQGIPANYRHPETGESGLMAAVSAEDFRIFRYFMERKVELNFVDKDNKTALDRAMEGVEKANKRTANIVGEVPRTLLKSFEMARRLREAGAKMASELKNDPASAHLFFRKGNLNVGLVWGPSPKKPGAGPKT